MKIKFKVKLDDDGKRECLVVPMEAFLAHHFEKVSEDNTYIRYMTIYEHKGRTLFSTGMSVIARLWNTWPTVEVEVPDDLEVGS